MKKILLAALVGVSCQTMAAPKVVATIKPLHSLVAQVMDGIGEPELLIKQGSPQGYQKQPAAAKRVGSGVVILYGTHAPATFNAAASGKKQKGTCG